MKDQGQKPQEDCYNPVRLPGISPATTSRLTQT
jgi:hypothetical protein